MKEVLAIDVGATNTRVAIVDNEGNIRKKLSAKTIRNSEKDFLENLKKLSAQIRADNKIDGIGVSIAGRIDQKKGFLISSPNLPFKNVELAKILEKELNLPVYLNNDANAAAISEKVWGLAQQIDNFIFITFSSGIGTSAFVKNKLVSGKFGNSIEAGHLEIKSEFGLACGCGGKNHWESYASGLNMPNFLKAWAKTNKLNLTFDGSNIFTILTAIEAQNEQAVEFFEQVAEINNIGINLLIKKYEPELIVLGGGVYLNHQELFKKYLPKKPIFNSAVFGENASLVGAAASIFYSK